MESDIKSEIVKNIKQSGIPLQIYSAVTLDNKKWNVTRGPIYAESASKLNNANEIDILAKKESVIKGVKNVLVIECKKQETKPWVFFKQNNVNVDPITLNISCNGEGGGGCAYEFFEKNFNRTHYFNKPLYSYYLHPFSSRDDETRPNPIFKAITQVVMAFAFYMNQDQEFLNMTDSKQISLFYPVIVLDGRLFSANISNEEFNEYNLTEEDHISLLINYELEKPYRMWSNNKMWTIKTKRLIIDIVKKEYLETFLDEIK